MSILTRIRRRLRREAALQYNRFRVWQLSREISETRSRSDNQPVLFFNASTRLSGLSQNAGFSLMISLMLQKRGVPVHHFVCNRGMRPCVLGTDRENPEKSPPCAECVRTSRYVFAGSLASSFTFKNDEGLNKKIAGLGLDDLLRFEYKNIPLGKLILPSLRWILRRHHLKDDETTRTLAAAYIRSAWNVYQEFTICLSAINPQSVVVFNGMFFPEAAARLAARERGIKVYSHEVGMRPFSVFMTDGEATAYPVDVPDTFQLTGAQNERLDNYLTRRFSGNFSTAGVEFWPEMKTLDKSLMESVSKYDALVPIFTNVIFDTSQVHANTLFEHMFEWLDDVVEVIRRHPEILFVIRAHPDEVREGKASRESVADWFKDNKLYRIKNLVFIPADKYISSYELIDRAKFVMVYNSTVGLEASLKEKPVLCAGKARYTQVPTVFLPVSKEEYLAKLETFIKSDSVKQKPDHRKNARRVLYNQLFRASLPLDEFLEEDQVWRGYVRIKPFPSDRFDKGELAVMDVIATAILDGKQVILHI